VPHPPTNVPRGEADTSGSYDDSAACPSENNAKGLRLFAALIGLLGAVLALAAPFLPVRHDITTLKWPTAQGTQSVSAPLVAYSPVWLDATIPCATARSLDARTAGPATVVSTNPPTSDYGKLTGLAVQVANDQITVLSRGQEIGTAPMAGGTCTIAVHSDGHETRASVGDRQLARLQGDQRPQLTGIFSRLDSSVDDVRGLSFRAEIDDRYQSYAAPLKIVALVLAIACFAGSIVALRRIDVRAGRRPPRFAPSGWWRPTFRDAAVFGALVLWWLVGAMTADDGYFLTMARARPDLGYVSDFYRWFAVAVAPMGWHVELYAWWVQISTSTPWVRLPALLMGIVSWLLISREVLPRLGQQVRRSHAAGWAAAAVFLAFWMPYNNGLRPEPVVVVFSLLALCAVERTIATGRLVPATLGLVCAALSLAANPHGMVAVLPFVAALKPLLRLVRARANRFGWLPVLAPIACAGFIILTLAFADQTWQSVMDSATLRKQIGPNQTWYQELHRYNLLFSQSPDGSLTRRFPVLLVMLCLAMCAVVLLRRGQIGGAALGPSRRLLAVTALSFVALALTPTKHTHHFGIFAAYGGALAALTALATSSTVLRSKRNRAVFFAGLMVILAFSATGTNAWWYVSGWGVPWYDKPPSFQGHYVSTAFLVVAGIAIVVAFVEHMRLDEHRPEVATGVNRGKVEKRSRALRLGTAPLSIICALLMVGELATFAKVIQKQWNSYSLGADNIRQLTGSSCGLSDYVYAETNPQAGMLRVSPQQPSVAAQDLKVPKWLGDQEDPNDYLRAKLDGFDRGGLPPGTGTGPQEPDWRPPHQFGKDNAPVWGSYDPKSSRTKKLRTQWYDLPERAAHGEVPVVLSLAGADARGNGLVVEFGRDTDHGFEIMHRHYVGLSGGPGWRDHRVTVGGPIQGATKMRIAAVDQSLAREGWLAVSAPRAPQLSNMTDVVGDAPTFVEWTAALVHPCLEMSTLHNGIAEMPKFRVAGGGAVRDIGQGWSSPDAGGPFGWLNVAASVREMPTYLRNNIDRDWGSLYAVDPYEPAALPAQAAMSVHTETHWGMWSPGPLTKPVQLPGDVPSSDDRTDLPQLGGQNDEPQR
jgi:arabinosyltransferase C